MMHKKLEREVEPIRQEYEINEHVKIVFARPYTRILIDDTPWSSYLHYWHPDGSLAKNLDEVQVYKKYRESLTKWVQNDYDLDFLALEVAFPLIRKLKRIGVPSAIKRHDKELWKRIKSKRPTFIQHVLEQGYQAEFTPEQMSQFLEAIRESLKEINLLELKDFAGFLLNKQFITPEALLKIFDDDKARQEWIKVSLLGKTSVTPSKE